MNTLKKFGRKDASGAPAVPPPNTGESLEAFQARCKTLGCVDAAVTARWKEANPAAPNNDSNELTAEQVRKMVQEAVNASFEAQGHKNIDQAALAKAIADEMAKQDTDSKSLTADQVKAIADAAGKVHADTVRKAPVNVRNNADAGSGSIEIPFSLTKGNLPLHYKQMLNVCMRKSENDGIGESDLVRGKQLGDAMLARLGRKALDSTTAGSGDEWVPTDLSSQLQRRLYAESLVAQMFLGQEIDMPTDPYEFPLSTTRLQFFINNAQGSAQTESTPGSGKIVLSTVRFAGKALFSVRGRRGCRHCHSSVALPAIR